MKKPWVRKLLIGLGIFFGLILIANFALNIWLKTQLPDYVKKNTDYKVSYKRMDVDLMTGNIFASAIEVESKNPTNTQVIGLKGSIDTLKISRFGIFDAVFNKKISSTDLLLANPNLEITLADAVDKKTGKKKNPVSFENIRIRNGKITVFKPTKEKFLSVQDLDLIVENLETTEDVVEDKLPVVFDSYSIRGENFFFQPNTIYQLTIAKITTKDGQMSVENFYLKPLVSFDDFKKNFPMQKQLLEFAVPQMNFKDITLKKNKVSLSGAHFINPRFLVYTNNAVASKKEKKPFNFDIDLKGVQITNASAQLIKPDGTDLLLAKKLNLSVNDLVFNKETSSQVIPVHYSGFKFSGEDILLAANNYIHFRNININPKNGSFNEIAVTNPGNKTDLKLKQIAFNINDWKIEDKKLNLDVKNVLVDGVAGVYIPSGEKAVKKKQNFAGIQFPVTIRNIQLKNSDFTLDKDNQPLSFKQLNAQISNLEIAPRTDNSGLAFKVKDYSLSSSNFSYKTKFYLMTVGNLNLAKNKAVISNFAMKPLVSRAQFIKMIPVESDLYDLKFSQISAAGDLDFFSENKSIRASNVTISNANANIFRSKVPADDPKIKPLYSKMLRSINIPMFVDHLYLKNSYLEYEEDTKKSDGPGKLTFSNFNMHVQNLNSAKMKGKPTEVKIKIDCSFLNASPLSVNWNFNTADQSDRFRIAGRATGIPASSLNAFIVPYMNVSATGTIQEMLFDFKGNPKGLGGSFKLKHKDLKIALLDKQTKAKKNLLSAVANVFIKSTSDKFPESVEVEGVERDPTKSFFNMFWKGIEDGLKKTLIGESLAKTTETVKDVTKSVKEEAKSPSKTEEPPKKKGFMKGVFRKKEKSETK
ncbi:hypothetical protein [Chryseobacterium caseinilyticum]|uniref:AsmA-like C-terminal domain-containing protein n=1 Tax=Chryseobacterium caseinilyticum TaxID=2771428 RepID=A0ABR8ZCY9_9FLAO|nr:hypothetical protein [Chryseobacterium caseinilyticum]MBD8083179.1 hypothetical protein [Chryseobacterium caseinilyticum]